MKGYLKQTGKCPTNGIALMTSYTTTMVMNDSLFPIIWVVIGLLPAIEQVILWLWYAVRYGNMGLGTNRELKLLDRVRQYEVWERRQEMLVCANAEGKWVVRGQKRWEKIRDKKKQSSWWARTSQSLKSDLRVLVRLAERSEILSESTEHLYRASIISTNI